MATGVVVAAPDVPTAALVGGVADASLLRTDRFVDLIERIDRVLGAVVDLLNTVRRLFGAGGD